MEVGGSLGITPRWSAGALMGSVAARRRGVGEVRLGGSAGQHTGD